MADLTMTTRATNERSITLVKKPSHADQTTAPAGEDITFGQLIRLDGTTGRWVKAAGSSAATLPTHMAWKTVKAGQSLTGVRGCWVEGFVLDALAYGAKVYSSNTAGAVGDAAGTSPLAIGTVVSAWAQLNGVAGDKLLDVGSMGN